jgi:hypothetical protein
MAKEVEERAIVTTSMDALGQTMPLRLPEPSQVYYELSCDDRTMSVDLSAVCLGLRGNKKFSLEFEYYMYIAT